MRIKQGFKLRTVGSEYIVTGESLQHVDFNKLISLNTTAAYLWQEVEGKEFSVDTLAELLKQKYGIAIDVAIADASEVADKWIKAGIAEE